MVRLRSSSILESFGFAGDASSKLFSMQKYHLEFILHTYGASEQSIKSSLAEFGEAVEVSDSNESGQKGRNLTVSVNTEEPTAIFDLCSQFGRIKSIKVNELK